MKTRKISMDEAMALVKRVDEKYKPAFTGISAQHAAAIASYVLPHGS